jgi:cell division protein FtsQ
VNTSPPRSTPLPPISSKNVRRKKQSEAVSEPPRPPPATIPPRPPTESRTTRILRGVVGFVMVVGIGGGVAYGARRYVKTSPRFAVTEIVTTGAKRRSPDELTATAGIAKGQNVFTVDLDRARTRLLADPWISDADLSRQLPGTLFVHVKEREAAGLVAASGGETYLVTRDGVVIKRLEAGDPSDLQIVTGVTVQELVDDREAATRKIRRALDLAFDYDHGPLGAGKPLQEIHVEPNGEMTLVIGKSAVAVHLGAPPYRRKLEQAVRVVAELDRRGAKPDAIMLDNEARPDRVVVRMR